MHLMFPGWQLRYLAAVSEDSAESLRERVDDAERAILTRLEQLSRTSGREMEKQAIATALDTLYMIKRDKLDFGHRGQPPMCVL
jgi:hypothetical protein